MQMKIGSTDWKALIRREAASLAVEPTPSQLEAFSIHARELLFWNRRSNLTAIADPAQMAVKHFVDSLVPIGWMPTGAAVLDVGSGAGFPGIPLKVVRPDLSVTLIDAVRKKVSFVKHVIRRLGLSGIEAFHVRAEQMAGAKGPGTRRRFDVVISRAVGAPEALAPLALPLLDENGILVAMRGKPPPGPSAIGSRFGPLQVFAAFDYRLPGTEADRSIWCLHRAP